MDYLERAEQITKGFENFSKREGGGLHSKEVCNFDAISAYALMDIARSLRIIARQGDSE